ncbi:Gmad2 immunoglobulin-like domain-containing protein [Neobacillus drentensis]
MKKIGYLFMIVIAAIGLVACNNQQSVEEKPSVSKPKPSVTEPKPSVTEPEPEIEPNVTEPKPSVSEPKGENPSTPNQPAPNNPEEKVYQNEIFKDVIVKATENEMIVKGKAQVFEGVFQYALYDGKKVVKESNYQTAGAPAWGDFEIKFAKELITSTNARFELFVFSAKDGSKINTLEIPIPKP